LFGVWQGTACRDRFAILGKYQWLSPGRWSSCR
jgi:hypothetical protein